MLARVFLNSRTIFCAKKKKNRIFLNAHTTASTQKRQVSVLKSNYPKNSLSGGTINEVTTAAKIAMHKTTFFFKKGRTWPKRTDFKFSLNVCPCGRFTCVLIVFPFVDLRIFAQREIL